MKKIDVRFERKKSLDHIEVIVCAPKEDETVKELLRQLRGQSLQTLSVFDDEGAVCVIDVGEIVLASVHGKLVKIISENGSWYTRRTLQSLEDELDEQHFLRLSRYELVNIDKIRRYDFTVAGTLRLELTGGMETWASRRCIPAIRMRLLGKE